MSRPARFPDFVTTGELEAMFSITSGQLRIARRAGLLVEGWHWQHGPRSGSRGLKKYLYHKDRIRDILPDIRAYHKWQTLKSRNTMLFNRLRTVRNKEMIAANSVRKRQLGGEINGYLVLEKDLLGQLEQAIIERRNLEQIYWRTPWERSDCPYCQGKGVIRGVPCEFCKE